LRWQKKTGKGPGPRMQPPGKRGEEGNLGEGGKKAATSKWRKGKEEVWDPPPTLDKREQNVDGISSWYVLSARLKGGKEKLGPG